MMKRLHNQFELTFVCSMKSGYILFYSQYGKTAQGQLQTVKVCSCPFCVYRTFGQNVQKWKGELMKYLLHRLYVPPQRNYSYKKSRRKTMQEEVTQKTIALVFKSSRLTADVLKKAMKLYRKRLIFRYDRKNPRLLFSSRSTLTIHI